MDKAQFFAKFEGILNMDPGSLKVESAIRDLDGWDSVAALSVIAMIDESYGVTLEGTEILKCPTVNDLASLVEDRGT